jgi:hypothetical protein
MNTPTRVMVSCVSATRGEGNFVQRRPLVHKLAPDSRRFKSCPQTTTPSASRYDRILECCERFRRARAWPAVASLRGAAGRRNDTKVHLN